MSDTENIEWLEEVRAETYTRLKHMKDRVKKYEDDLVTIDALTERLEESRSIQENSDATRAHNDQLQSELNAARVELEELHSERGARLDPD